MENVGFIIALPFGQNKEECEIVLNCAGEILAIIV